MKVLLIPNTQKDEAIKIAESVYNILNEKSVDIYSFCDCKTFFSELNINFINKTDDFKNIDIAFVIGGDGTIIGAANLLLESEIPIFGINCGTLGFLAAIESSEIEKIIDVIEGNYLIQERITLKTTIHSKQESKSFLAINDVVISKNTVTGILDIDVECSNIKTAHYRGDGVIISTPSGSTAYAMSAGGPIMHPYVKAIAITPICAHSLQARTMVLPENEKISIKTNAGAVNKSAYVVADGKHYKELQDGDTVEISRYNKNIKFITLNTNNYYFTVNRKLMEG